MRNSHKKRLMRSYNKSFKFLIKSVTKDQTVGILLFNTYLKYLRDTLILSASFDLTKQFPAKTKIATLTAAAAEFDSWQKCEDKAKKIFHWNNFCELVKLNIEDWLTINDSI